MWLAGTAHGGGRHGLHPCIAWFVFPICFFNEEKKPRGESLDAPDLGGRTDGHKLAAQASPVRKGCPTTGELRCLLFLRITLVLADLFRDAVTYATKLISVVHDLTAHLSKCERRNLTHTRTLKFFWRNCGGNDSYYVHSFQNIVCFLKIFSFPKHTTFWKEWK
jgi:hypothetical protein